VAGSIKDPSVTSVSPMTTTKSYRKLTIGLTAAAVLAAGVGVANAGVAESGRTGGWAGVTREQVRIDFGKGWVTKAELTRPDGARGRDRKSVV